MCSGMSIVPEGFKEYYHGPQDIPPEHRIFAYPEKAEPVHSILEVVLNVLRYVDSPKLVGVKTAQPCWKYGIRADWKPLKPLLS